MRLDKFLCKSTKLSRAEATQLILEGVVTVDGKPVLLATLQVHENNRICLKGEPLTARPSQYILLNKPKNTESSNVDGKHPSLMHLLDIEGVDNLHIAGRLDADTTGLVLITDDGRWSFNIIRPDKECEKVYRVGLRDALGDPRSKYTVNQIINLFEQGIQLQGEYGPTAPAKLVYLNSRQVLLTITEGKFHQVKRMFAAVGNRVVQLHRQSIGDIKVDVEVGQWRYLREDEIAYFL